MNRRIMFLAMLATPALVLLPCRASAAAPGMSPPGSALAPVHAPVMCGNDGRSLSSTDSASRRYVVMGSRSLERSGHRVIAYDARGHGRSSPAAARFLTSSSERQALMQ